jgi:Tol biopolymer transport system component
MTGSIGQEADLNWSPGSDFIAFGQTRAGSFDVMVMPVAGGVAEVRADGPGTEAGPRWSPDGKYLAYLSSSEPGSPVFLVPPHGGNPRRLISTDIRTLDIDTISWAMGDRPWSSDGKTLLVSRVTKSGQTTVWRVDRDNGDAVQMTFPPPGSEDLSPSHSFDGAHIAFQRRRNGKGVLMTMPSSGGEPQVLLEDRFDNTAPAWRPDNRHILFISARGGEDGGANIWEIDTGGGLPRQLTFDTRRVISVSVSADNRVAYVLFWHDTSLMAVDVETGEIRQLNAHPEDNYGARFSPYSASIAYHSTRTGNSEIWLFHTDGRQETQITDNGSWDMYPDWSPDGDRMLFVSDREGARFRLFTVNRDGGGERLLVDKAIKLNSQIAPVIGSLASRWSPDGERIAFLAEGEAVTGLWIVGADGEDARVVIDNAIEFDWYLDSRRGIFARHHGGQSELVAVDLETGREQSLFVGPFLEIDVAPNGSAVAFCFGDGHMAMGLAVLRLEESSEPEGLPRAAGEPQYVVSTSGTWHVHNGGWSPDSKHLVYTRDLDYGDIYELVERR